ncbi:hypothetical protein EJ02DRAFT_264000 [Clathrospora elynae]|uniref:Rhodopsin domain-containing protein n=1 Tax=Clathrospora elynae TaxID=706981 RepID=A0A6A5SEY4_9PLEO|nr:hypothetical protein EJ02DRAFT_264000 [Clathrospora elynae]
MGVDVRDLPSHQPPSSIAHGKESLYLAIVGTLVFIALLSCSPRAHTHGRLHRSFAIDDVLMLVAALCAIGVFVTFVVAVKLGSKKHQWDASINYDLDIGPWTLGLTLLHVLGLGFVKLSATFFLLRIFDRRYCRYLLYGFVCFMVPFTFEWFMSALFQCVPVAAAWNTSLQAVAQCMSQSTYTNFTLANNTINATTDLLLVVLIIPIAFSGSLSRTYRAVLMMVLCLGTTAFAAAIVRIRVNSSTWHGTSNNTINSISSAIWAMIELATALIATNLATTHSNFRFLTNKRRPTISHPSALTRPNRTSDPNTSYASRYSNQTVIYRPNTAYFPSLARFHDDESNLDFDIETTSTETARSRADTLASTTHTRNVSDWSQFSGFTYYTNATEADEERRREKSRGRVSTLELEDIVKSLGLARGGCGGLGEELYISDVGGEQKREGSESTECDGVLGAVRNGADEGSDEEDEEGVSLQSEADSSEITVHHQRMRF